jgi:ABC-2 type transport system ATP-binding protein
MISRVPVVSLDQVGKVYRTGIARRRTVEALRDVSLRVEPGEVLGIVGPNRAGKSTLIKIVLSLCTPTTGRVTRFGREVGRRVSTLSEIGYVHEHQSFPRYLTAASALEYYGALALVPPVQLRHRIPSLLAQVGLGDRQHDTIGTFSKGMVQRLALAQALVNEPELLILDEPTEGLDELGRALINDVIEGQRQRGGTTMLVSHVLGDIERLCDRVAVLVRGELIALDTVANLSAHRHGEPRPTLGSVLLSLYGAHDR